MKTTDTATLPTPTGTNRRFSLTYQTKAPPAAVWRVWAAVANWKDWDLGLADGESDGPLQLGTTGTITALNGRRTPFIISAFEDGTGYTIKTKLILSDLYVRRTLQATPKGTAFTHDVWFEGFTAGLFARFLGPQFRTLLPQSMQRIREIATAKS